MVGNITDFQADWVRKMEEVRKRSRAEERAARIASFELPPEPEDPGDAA